MNLRPSDTSSCTSTSPLRVLQMLLLSLLLTPLASFTVGEWERNLEEAEGRVPAFLQLCLGGKTILALWGLEKIIILTTVNAGVLWHLSIRSLSPGIERYVELRCMCVNTISGIHPGNIQNLEVIKAGPHCAQVEVIATLKNEKKICLDPESPKIKKIIQKILESGGSAA
ncbi:hypothetical protein MC885_019509 [Smutsia gigantea]|nr:hypothetical protein MC885_019509 [Smutsia gigantea]